MDEHKFWAKKGEESGRYYWLPLEQHMDDTMAVSGLLWEHWLSNGQRELISSSISSPSLELTKVLVRFLGAVHDIGKATPAFQTMSSFNASADLDRELLDILEINGFNDISNLQLHNREKSHHTISGHYILSNFGIKEDVCSIISAHHGKPLDDYNIILEQQSYLANYFQVEDPSHPIYKKWELEQKRFLNRALSKTGLETIEDLPTISRPIQVVLSGLIIMADWIASNTRYFPLIPLGQDVDVDQAQRVQSGWNAWYKTSVWEPEAFMEPTKLYEKRFGFSPREFQSKLIDLIDSTEKPGLFIIEAPMGHGKTEAALAAAERLAHITGKSGVFFGLPTQATSNGIFPRIKNWLQNVAKDFGDSLPIRLIHGKAALNEEFVKIPLSSQVNIDQLDENESVVVNEWFSGRKTSNLEDFTVGTVDQFLLLALKQKHLALRHLGFSKKVVIIDEVHAYDAYMNQYLVQAIKWMAAYNVPVIILSATLPATTREELLKGYMRGLGLKWKDEVLKEDLEENKLAYPLISFTDGPSVKQYSEFSKSQDKKIKINNIYEEDLFDILENLTIGDGIVGIIVNTVKRSQLIAKECVRRFGEERVELLHSNFIATDRAKKEKKLIELIGKGAVRPKSKIIIGTQVMEQSLDIDFDVLITDLAPMDLLIQRIGRLHRHSIERPDQFRDPVLFVMGNDENYEFESGSSAVYGDYLLAKTKYYLNEEILIPGDISKLVQQVYSEDSCEDWEGLECIIKKMQDEYQNKIDEKVAKAKTFRIDEPKSFSRRLAKTSLVGWLSNTHPNTSEEMAYAQVRDTDEVIEVIALRKCQNGYSCFGEEENLSERISELRVGKKIANQSLNLPRLLSSPYYIEKTIDELEKYNKKYLPDWQDQVWLKGNLGVIFDESNNFFIGNHYIHYSEKYGLTLHDAIEEGANE